MNIRNVFLLAAAIMLFSGNATFAASTWQTAAAYEQILTATKEENKPFILYFHASWCGYCQQFNTALLNNPAVEQVLSHYVRVKINPEDGEKENLLAMQHGVRGYPYFLVVRPSGERIRIHPFHQGSRIWSAEEFIARLKTVLEAKN